MQSPKKKKPRILVPRTRGAGKFTEQGFWGWLRSGLRRLSRRWPPIYATLNSAKRKSQSSNPRLKWEYQCAACIGWFPMKQVSVDHIVPAGSLTCAEDLPGFVTRLFCEEDNLQVLCDPCHDAKTKEDKADDRTK